MIMMIMIMMMITILTLFLSSTSIHLSTLLSYYLPIHLCTILTVIFAILLSLKKRHRCCDLLLEHFHVGVLETRAINQSQSLMMSVVMMMSMMMFIMSVVMMMMMMMMIMSVMMMMMMTIYSTYSSLKGSSLGYE